MRGLGSLVAAAMLSTASCGEDASTLTMDVRVRTDLTPGVEFASVRVEMRRDADGSVTDAETVSARVADDYLRGVGVVALDVEPGTWFVRVELLRPDGAPLVERVVSVDVAGDVTVDVVITRDCRTVACPDGESCVGGQCVDQRCATGLEPECGAPECDGDPACTSEVACVAGSCVDGVCLSTPRDDRCGELERCDVERGCESTSSGADADVGVAPDAGDAGGGVQCGSTRCLPTETCSELRCCPYGHTWCPSVAACADLTSDESHCGTCGVRCSTECVRGYCKAADDECESARELGAFSGRATTNVIVRPHAAFNSVGSCGGGYDVFARGTVDTPALVFASIGSGENGVGLVPGPCGTAPLGCSDGCPFFRDGDVVAELFDAGPFLVVVDGTVSDMLVVQSVPVSAATDTLGRVTRLVPGVQTVDGDTTTAEHSPGTRSPAPDLWYYFTKCHGSSHGTLEVTCDDVTFPLALELMSGDGRVPATGTCDSPGDTFEAVIPDDQSLYVLFVDGQAETDKGAYRLTITVPPVR
jgi:hypothetical protein